MGKWNNRWIPNQRNYRHDNRRRMNGDAPPPYLAESNESSVPEWEKKFCYKVGSVPWRKVLDTKSFASYYPDVMDWDDSEAKDTFCIAKRRFWALMDGLPADDVPLPDPNAYIDEIDWNNIETELYIDLESALVASDRDVEGVTQAGGSGVVDISALTQNSKWHDWSQGTAGGWDNGGCWDKYSDGGWAKADKWDSVPGNAITDDPKITESVDNPWECVPSKTNEPVKNFAWGDFNDRSRGWKQPESSCQTINRHDVGNLQEGSFQGHGAEKGNGWTSSRNNSWSRNSQQNKDKTKAGVYGSIEHIGTSEARKWSRHGDNSQCENSLANNQHKLTEVDHKGNGNWTTGNKVDRKRESSNDYAPWTRNPMFQHPGNRRHEPGWNTKSISTFRFQT